MTAKSTTLRKKLEPKFRDGHFLIYTDEFLEVLGSAPKFAKLVETNAHEGPVYFKKWNAVLYTTLPQPTNNPVFGSKEVAINMLSLDNNQVSTIREPSNMANGMTLDRERYLLICEQGTKSKHARISYLDLNNIDPDNLDPSNVNTEVLVNEWFGLRLNSPNDIVVKSDGTVWFTDPSYGFLQNFKYAPQIGDFVYQYDPATGSLSVVADSFDKPNGLAFSPDENILYITDSGAIQEPGSYYVNRPHHIRAFDVIDGKCLANPRLFAAVTPGIPDGIKVDTEGRVYTGTADGVQVFNPQGELIGKILVENGVANFTFGGFENNILYMMADKAIYAATLQAQGIVNC